MFWQSRWGWFLSLLLVSHHRVANLTFCHGSLWLMTCLVIVSAAGMSYVFLKHGTKWKWRKKKPKILVKPTSLCDFISLTLGINNYTWDPACVQQSPPSDFQGSILKSIVSKQYTKTPLCYLGHRIPLLSLQWHSQIIQAAWKPARGECRRVIRLSDREFCKLSVGAAWKRQKTESKCVLR